MAQERLRDAQLLRIHLAKDKLELRGVLLALALDHLGQRRALCARQAVLHLDDAIDHPLRMLLRQHCRTLLLAEVAELDRAVPAIGDP